ncbi:MAG TPA: glycosyltransferase [Kiritimatiellia bacterium]|nr:glycosyltransferase [Kiritimatiellia bacterium]
MTPRISFLVPDINSPVIGPVTVLARSLESAYDVEIVGPDFGHGVCPMYRDSYPYRAVSMPRLYRLPEYWQESRRLGQALTGDVLIAVKAYADTVPVVLREKKRRGVKALAYLDEWDGALQAMRPWPSRIAATLKHLHHPLEDWAYPWVERMIPKLDGVWSTTTWLQKRFGGEVVHMGVDTEFFRPLPVEATQSLKRDYGLGEMKLIVFGGVVRPHKGIELILEALARIGRTDYRLVIIGPKNQHVEALEGNPRFSPYLVALGSRAKEDMPAHLAMADVMVLPLSDNLLARSQMPCKVFEAMAMAKPVIGSAISDLPLILEGCGWIVPPGDSESLAQSIAYAFDRPEEAAAKGAAARAKCETEFSAEGCGARLRGMVEELIPRLADSAGSE